jgi:oligopeptidase B
MTAPESDPAPKNWKVFIPQQDDVLIEHIDLFQDFAVSVEKSQALDHLRVYDFHSANGRPIAFPEPVYAASPAARRSLRIADLSLQLPELHHAAQRFRLRRDDSGQSTLLKRQEVLGGYDPTQYVASACGPPRATA